MPEPRLEELRTRYSPQPVPPCRVCGEHLECGSSGIGESKWYCSAVKDIDSASTAHWWASELVIASRSDIRVIELINFAEALKAENERLRAALLNYGEHRDWCAFKDDTVSCSCGFGSALARAGEPGE